MVCLIGSENSHAREARPNINCRTGISEKIVDFDFGAIAIKADVQVLALHFDLGRAEGVKTPCSDTTASGTAPVGVDGSRSQAKYINREKYS